MKRQALGFLALVPLLASCGGARPPLPPTPTGPPATQVDATVVQGNTRLGIGLLQALRAQKGEQNWFLSPPSASLALSLAANGAKGQTQAEILKALGLDGLSIDQVNAANRDLQSILRNPDPKVELSVANSLWVKSGKTIAKSFGDLARANYGAVVAEVPFGDPKAAAQINDWVKQATKGKIPTLVEETNPLDRLYIVNALYLNAKWTTPFDANWTKPEPFTGLDGKAKTVPMMHQGGSFRYLKGEGFQAAAIPFGAGRLSLYLFRPDDSVGLNSFLAKMSSENWATWMSKFAPMPGSIALPKFKLESEADLIPPLMQLGMKTAFDASKAEFPSFFDQNPEPLFISLVRQKTFLAVDETGAEAAAATVVGMATGSAGPVESFDLRLDRPFFLAIRDDQTGALLFLGTVVNPG